MKRRGIAARAGHWSATHRKQAILLWVGLVVVSLVGGGAVGMNELSDAEEYTGESRAAEFALAGSDVSDRASETVLIESETLTASDPAFQRTAADVEKRLADVSVVRNIESPLKEEAPVSEDGHAALVNFELAGDADDASETAEPVMEAVEEAQVAHPDFTVSGTGDGTAENQFDAVLEEDFQRAEMLSLPISLLILVVAFGALVAAGIPVVLAGSAVAAAIGLVSIPSQVFPVDDSISSVMLLIGMAVGVDYSLFYLRREREERRSGREPREALDAAAATSGRAVLISGLTVMAAMAGLFLSGSDIFVSFGVGTLLVVGIAMLGSITVLPALISWLGDRVEKGRIPLIGRLRHPDGESRVWGGVVSAVMRRPVASLVVAGGALVALAIPAFGMNTNTTSIDELPQDLSAIQTYQRIQDVFPSESPPAVLVVQADDVRADEVTSALRQVEDRAREADVAVAPASAEVSSDGKLVEYELPLAGDGEDETSKQALAELREQIIPAAFAGVDAVVNVTGETAGSVDFQQTFEERLPIVFAFVLAVAFVLLLVTFRSIVVPITSIAMNVLSVGAAYGILVLVFQEGFGQELLGANSDGVTNWLPLFLFVILFGLSMDYHVFLLSRIKEAVDRGMSTERAVEVGVRSTAGTITAAAVVMVAVFSIFATLSFIDMKQMGVGLAAAVLIDATIVRGVLVPATMKLLGERNWYLPSWLGWLPRIRGEGQVAAPRRGDAAPEGARA